VHVGDGLDGVVEAVAVLPAVAEDLVVLHPSDHVLHAGADLRWAALSSLRPAAGPVGGACGAGGVTIPQWG
jgi:hypothetical protein